MALEDRLASIVDSPLKHLERTFSELAAGMTGAGDTAAELADNAVGDEKYAQIITMVHARGIATGLELAATEIGKARAVVQEAVDEMRAES